MAKIKIPNEIIIFEDFAEIILKNKNEKEIGRTIVDLNDLYLLKQYKWYMNTKNKFVYADVNDRSIYMHRLLMNVVDNKGIYVDHINHNRLDNRRNNIRICSNMENMRNQIKQKNRSSNIIGVSWAKDKKRWFAYIWIDYKRINLGKYKNIEDATTARLNAELKYFGEFAPQKNLFEKYRIMGDEN